METATRDADTNPEQIFYDAALNADALFDNVSIQLYKDLGTFVGGEIEPRIVALSGAEANYETCGACVLVYVDVDPDSEFEAAGEYMAEGGTLNLMSVTPNLRGRLSNVTLTHVHIDSNTFRSTPVGDCSSSITSLEFDIPVETEMGFRDSKPRHLRKR
jgi:hypothetical protein